MFYTDENFKQLNNTYKVKLSKVNIQTYSYILKQLANLYKTINVNITFNNIENTLEY